MPPLWRAALVYLACISLVAIIVTAADKWKAQHRCWRIPEATLLLLAALGGSLAMLVTMRAIRHKTRKKKFMVGIPLILVAQIALFAALALKINGFF